MSRQSPRILAISHDAGRTGAPIGLLAFLNWLREAKGAHTGIILRNPGPLERSFQKLGPTLTLGKSALLRWRLGRRLRGMLPHSIQTEARSIRNICSKGEYNVIYSNTATNGEVLEILSPLGLPVVTHVHELDYWITRAGPTNWRQVVSNTSRYIAAAQAVRDNLVHRHGISSNKVDVVYEHIRSLPAVPSAAERAAARSALGIPHGAIVIGGCGAEHWRKGRDLIPQLLIALNRACPDRQFHVVWVGRLGSSDEEYALRHDLRAAGVEDRFHTSGEVANPFALFPAFDVFALLSRDDPYPLACLEVAATETPVVCFENAGGMPEFARDGCGLVAPYLDITAMANDILKLAVEPMLSLDCGRRARAKVARENTLDTTGPQLLEVIERAASR